jgi:hypothetical protein
MTHLGYSILLSHNFTFSIILVERDAPGNFSAETITALSMVALLIFW